MAEIEPDLAEGNHRSLHSHIGLTMSEIEPDLAEGNHGDLHSHLGLTIAEIDLSLCSLHSRVGLMIA